MKKMPFSIAFTVASLGFVASPYAAEVTLGPDLRIPPHYKPGGGSCSPGRGYSFGAEAPNHPSTYPKLNLRVFNGEVIGFTFELDANGGWKPWYDRAEGKPTVHDGSIKHYTQTIYFKKGPTAEECKLSKGPYGYEK